jgi:hypothetical protein
VSPGGAATRRGSAFFFARRPHGAQLSAEASFSANAQIHEILQ